MAQSAARLLPPLPREVLAEAVAERRRIAERIERLHKAIAQAREASLEALGRIDEAEERLAAAERTEERRAVAIALDEEVPEGPSLAEARQALVRPNCSPSRWISSGYR